jgi:acyl-CoA reductase-like NAD-dependent aldehyde dehydrogenase
MLKLSNFINGEFLPPLKGEYMDVFLPATGAKYADLPDSDSADIDVAVAAAVAAFPAWSTLAPAARSAVCT